MRRRGGVENRESRAGRPGRSAQSQSRIDPAPTPPALGAVSRRNSGHDIESKATPATKKASRTSKLKRGVLDQLLGYQIRRRKRACSPTSSNGCTISRSRPASWAAGTDLGESGDQSGRPRACRRDRAGDAGGIHRSIRARELVERRGLIGDRRSYALHLTRRGQEFIDEAIPAVLAHESAFTDHLPPAERATLLKLLAKMADKPDGVTLTMLDVYTVSWRERLDHRRSFATRLSTSHDTRAVHDRSLLLDHPERPQDHHVPGGDGPRVSDSSRCNIGAGDQFEPRIPEQSVPTTGFPAIVDRAPADGGEPISVFESGAILLYLAEKTGKLLPARPARPVETLEWLIWQVAGLGPMAGQNHHFGLYAPEKMPYAIDRYVNETNRLYGVLDRRLEGRDVHRGRRVHDRRHRVLSVDRAVEAPATESR